MPDVAELLAELADRPPSPPRPVAEIARDVRRRRAWRRGRLMAAVASVFVIALALGAVVLNDDRPTRVTTVPRVDDAPVGRMRVAPFDPAVVIAEGNGLTVAPSTDLEDNDEVELGGWPAPWEQWVPVTCAAEVIQFADSPETLLSRDWCVQAGMSAGREPTTMTLTVSRVISTPAGAVDCAIAPGRCVAAVVHLTGNQILYAPVTFAEGLEPATDVRVEVHDATDVVTDGQHVVVDGSGFQPGTRVILDQCRGTTTPVPEDFCDTFRSLGVEVGDDGRFSDDFVLYHDIGHTASSDEGEPVDEWMACQPCVIRVGVIEGAEVPIPIEVRVGFAMRSTPTPIRPSMAIETPGPYAPGQQVTLRGAGLQAAAGMRRLVICPSGLPPTPKPTYATCNDYGLPLVVPESDGTFVVENVPLPMSRGDWELVLTFGAIDPAQVIPLDMSG